MQAYEFPATISPDGKLELPPDMQLPVPANRAARIIVMIEEDSELDNEYCDNPTPEQIADNIRQAFREKQAGQRIPFSQLWDGIDTHVE